MLDDIIVEEVRTVREKLAEEYDCDIHKIGLMIKETEEEHKKEGWKIANKKDLLIETAKL